MEEKKAEVAAQWRKVKTQMRVFTINDLKTFNRKDQYPVISEKIETLLANLLILYDQLFDMKAGDKIKERYTQQKGEIKGFLTKLEERYYDLEEEEASKDKAFVPAAVKSVAGFEQLEDSRRREKEEKQAKPEKEKITKERTEANFHIESEGFKEKAELIFSPVTKIPLGIWKNVEEDKVEELEQRGTDLIAESAEADIILGDISGCLNTKQDASQAADSVQEANDELDSEDLVEKDEEYFAIF